LIENDCPDCTAKTKAGSDQLLGMRLAAQVLHVQWGWSDNMSTFSATQQSHFCLILNEK
jgi:hypothetical protein